MKPICLDMCVSARGCARSAGLGINGTDYGLSDGQGDVVILWVKLVLVSLYIRMLLC